MQWYYAEKGQQNGPVEEYALVGLVNAGVVRDDTLVWHEGLPNWLSYGSVREMRAAASTASVYAAQGVGVPVQPTAQAPAAAYIPHNYAAVAPGVHYAGFWIRFVAKIIDSILLNIALLVVRIPLGVSMFTPMTSRNPAAIMAIMGAVAISTLLSILITAAYETYFVSAKGATLGKMALGLKVVRPDGAPISMGLAAGRYFAQWLSAIIFMIGFIMAGFDDQKRALHDRICETRVIYSR
jgi:uncharacterized RDD family membrane protein YckC